MTEAEELISKIPVAKIQKIAQDPEQTAKAVKLTYISDTAPGITRVKKGSSFDYVRPDKKKISDEDKVRIKSLVIPPAWENVWICALENGHLQATGTDVKMRKQYRYHPVWNALRNHTKFFRMLAFGQALPGMRLRLEKDLSQKELTKTKVLAAVVSLMERTNIRVGNNAYEKLYGSFGLTTLKDKHASFSGNSVKFTFTGKKGVKHSIDLKNKKLAKIVRDCQDIPGKDLFQFYDEAGEHHGIDSGMVNDYVREISGGNEFTAKDFRTWAGTVYAFLAFKETGLAESKTDIKRNIITALDSVAKQLGNTRTVSKKYYVHPSVISLYETGELKKYLDELDKISVDDGKADLTGEEKIIMKILSSSIKK